MFVNIGPRPVGLYEPDTVVIEQRTEVYHRKLKDNVHIRFKKKTSHSTKKTPNIFRPFGRKEQDQTLRKAFET